MFSNGFGKNSKKKRKQVMKLQNIDIKRKRILVIGDVMLDVYYNGEVSRISPEAPVPVFKKYGERVVLGGAANVAINLAVAEQDVYVMSVIGGDMNGETLKRLLEENAIYTDYLYTAPNRFTTVKTRFLANNHQQVMRLDEETTDELTKEEYSKLIDILKRDISKFDSILISDYLKGFLEWEFTREIIRISKENRKNVIIDVKDSNILKYENATLLKPNLKELRDLTRMSVSTKEEIVKASKYLKDRSKCKYVLTTCGANGMILVGDGEPFELDSSGKEVFDVTGAGDTTVAYLTMALANEISLRKSVEIANYAAGVQVGKVGTSAVFLKEVEKAIGRNSELYENKIVPFEECESIRESYKDKTIVFTNGCFDILHVGHVRYLKEASKLGDVLVVGMNSDASVKILKGAERPINDEVDRAEMLCSFDFIDKVVVFKEETPLELIKKIQPDVLVKGGDYANEYVVGKKEVEEKGGKLVLIPFVDGKSTSNIINKIQN